MKIDQIYETGSSMENNAKAILSGIASVNEIEAWLNWKGRCNGGEVLEAATALLLSMVKSAFVNQSSIEVAEKYKYADGEEFIVFRVQSDKFEGPEYVRHLISIKDAKEIYENLGVLLGIVPKNNAELAPGLLYCGHKSLEDCPICNSTGRYSKIRPTMPINATDQP